MDRIKLISLLQDQPAEQVEAYASYCERQAKELDKDTKKPKNPWMGFKTDAQLADLFRRVASQGLVLDGKHITLQSTGISYDYVAYKNKMILAYPESIIDVQLVYNGDKFMVQKESGKVKYEHILSDPFNQEESKIEGGYCVIKNKRGEFLTVMGKDDIQKHRIVAKTDLFWKKWFKEMALKTIVKKACKFHFDDIFKEMEEADEENFNMDAPLNIDLKWKQDIEAITTIQDLTAYYHKHKGSGKEFDALVKTRKDELVNPPPPNANS